MNRFSTKMVKWLACGAVLLMSGTAYADYKKGDVVDLTPNLKGTVIQDQNEGSSSVKVELYQNPDNKPSGVLKIAYIYNGGSVNFCVESLAKSAFYDNREITSVDLSSNAGITSIPTDAFGKCTKLTNFDFSNIQYVHDRAFMYAISLKEAVMPKVWNIGDQAFAECSALTKVEIGNECRMIGRMALGKCSVLKQAILNHGLTTIEINNFTFSEELEDFVVPYTVTSIQSDLTDCSTMSRLFLLSPSFKEWIQTNDTKGYPIGYNLLDHSGLKEIYCLDELVEDVNTLLAKYKGATNFTTLEKATPVSELVEIVPLGEGKFKIIKHNEDIPFIEVCTSNYNGSLEDAQSFQRIFPDKDGIYTSNDGKAQVVYTVDKINHLRYVVDVTEPEPEYKYPVTEDQVVKMHGNIFKGSSDWTDGIMTKEDDLWVMKDITVKSGNFGIKIFENADAEKSTWVNSVNRDNPTVVLDEMNEGTASGGENWYIPKGTYTFTFNPGMYELYVTGTPDTTPDPDPVWVYYLHGNIADGGISWKDYELVEKDGAWSVSLEDIKGGQFVFKAYDTVNERTGSWYYSAKDSEEETATVKFDTEMPVVEKDGTNWTIGEGSYTFTLNPEAMTLFVTDDNAEDPTPDDPEPAPVVETAYYLVGTLPGWEPAEGYKFTKGENDEYTLEIETLTGEFKITDGDKAVWYGSNNEDAIELDKPYVCSTDNGGNFSFTEPVLNAKFTFDPEKKTLTITGTLQEIEHEYVYTMCGALTDGGEWKEYPMTLADDRWTLTLENGLVAFQIREYDKAVDENQVSRYIKSNTEEVVDQNGTYPATSKGGTDWTSKLDGNCTYTFNPEKMILTIFGTTGISSIEAENGEAIYFNLQGQRIANPDKGIFIRIVNGKAEKIVRQ